MIFWLILISVLTMSLGFGIFFGTTLYSVLFGAPFVPTDHRNVARMIEAAAIRPGEKFADLGSGDGRIVIAAAQAGARAEGWEVNPYLWLLSKFNIWRAGVGDRATVHLESYWWRKFEDADVVSLFLINPQMKNMQDKLRREMKPGSRVVSYAFKFPDWKPSSSRDGVHLYEAYEAHGGPLDKSDKSR
jgi:hypothetical protein